MTDETPGPTHDEPRDPSRLIIGVACLVAGLCAVVLGIQIVITQHQADAAAAREAAQNRADRAYADCLTRFASDLVDTLEARGDATARLQAAQALVDDAAEVKDQALDRVVTVVLLARRDPPEATPAQFDAALAARVDAQRHYDAVARHYARVEARVEKVRGKPSNQYVKPKARCQR